MIWRQTDVGWLGESEQHAKLLVALLPDQAGEAAKLRDVAALWAAPLPNAAFMVFERLDDLDVSLAATLDLVGLRPCRLLLVGFGRGAEIGLSVAFKSAECCAGVVAYVASPASIARLTPDSRETKIRLIGDKEGEPGERLSDAIHHMVALGIDARGIELSGDGLTRAAIRLGGAYLTELSASALATRCRQPPQRRAAALG
jgi:hypothetical protein